MKPLSLAQIAAMTGGTLLCGAPERHVHRVGTDSRSTKPGDLFVALRGEKFDGHTFLPTVAKLGAIAAVVARKAPRPATEGLGLIEVEDTQVALQRLAHAYRKMMPAKVVGITGSSGKTSTKEFIASVLSRLAPTRKTEGNLNNHLGVPLTLLSLDPTDAWAVVEMGMNHPGEIAALCDIALPDHGVITSIGWAHIEFFPDQEGIFHEKAWLVRSLRGGWAVLNGDDARLRTLAGTLAAETVFPGSTPDSFVQLKDPRWMGDRMVFSARAGSEAEPMELPVPGLHMVQNAGLAIALGLKAGLPLPEIREGLAAAQLPKSRVALRPLGKGWLLDDAYNANPDSMVAAFSTLALLEAGPQRFALLGAMGELGAWSERLHRWTGERAAEAGITHLFAVGEAAKPMVEAAAARKVDARWFISKGALVDAYRTLATGSDAVLVKGSRSQAMEEVTAALTGS
ncbi:MAG: UDP-N-acetylmuramoyl-tripeptide--D-alanyl-D-alanine ligase [Candidatus Methylacidiphilales bacterium]